MDTLTPVQILAIVVSIIMVIIISLRVTYRQYFIDVGHYTIPTLGNIYNNLQRMTVPSGFRIIEESSSEEPSSYELSSEEPSSYELSSEEPEQKLAKMYKIKRDNLMFPKLKLVSDTRPKQINEGPKLQNILENLSGYPN